MSERNAETAAAVMMVAKPERQHRWLEKLVGEWTYEASAGQQECTRGTESVRSIGGLWIQAEGQGEMPGGEGLATSVMTIGYDTLKKRFVGTWIGSMMTYMWVYDGELDAAERVLTLNSEGPSMADDGTMASYQDVIEFKSDNHRTVTGRVRTPEGTWQSFMTVDYRRKT
jgi:hypothetical protein